MPAAPAAATVRGLVLAAGAGTRFGGPKALARDADGVPWVVRAVEALRAGGCHAVTVVLGAGAEDAAALVPAGAEVVVAADWAEGLSHSLRAGLRAAGAASAVVVVPVDTPGLPAAAVARVIASVPDLPTGLARAVYGGTPGHPVLLGAAHWSPVAAEAAADAGAGPYLRRHGARAVECGDLWSGHDIDTRDGSAAGDARPPHIRGR